jgi:hypothetical protein
LRKLFGRAEQLYKNERIDQWKGDRVADFNQMEKNAIRQMRKWANRGTPLERTGANGLTNVLNGAYLSTNANPFLDDQYKQAAKSAMPGVDSQFTQSGGYGGSDWAGVRGQTSAGIANDIYGGHYQRERNNMMGALQMVPQYNASQRDNLSNL